jgi:hypothetical protein
VPAVDFILGMCAARLGSIRARSNRRIVEIWRKPEVAIEAFDFHAAHILSSNSTASTSRASFLPQSSESQKMVFELGK